PEIKVIFTGHTHQGYRCEVGGRLLIQGTSYGRGVSVVDVVLDRRTGRLIPGRTTSYNLPVINERTDPAHRDRFAAGAPAPYGEVLRHAKPDPDIQRRAAGFAALVAPKAQRVVGTATGVFTRAGTGDSSAGRLVADAQLAATRSPATGGAQLALMNPGGIRTDLECTGTPCNITFGQVFSMQPFGNTMMVMSYTGAQLKAVLE